MNTFVGTSGYSYKEWKGSFYPEDISPKQMLRFYAEKLSAVEINNTFYRLPRASVLQGWAEQVPADFRFALKASRRITHFKRLRDVRDETDYLLQTAGVMREKLGVILFQLPPNFKKDVERLDSFLDVLPADTRAAFEFRHESWFTEEVYTRLRARGLAVCIAETEMGDPPVVGTASWGYARLRRADYADEDLAEWAKRFRDLGWEDAYVFFKHEDEGAGPRLAGRFIEIATAH